MTMFVSMAPGSMVTRGMSANGRRGAGRAPVVGQPLDVMIKRVEAAGRQDPGLPQGSAEHLLVPPGLVDQLP